MRWHAQRKALSPSHRVLALAVLLLVLVPHLHLEAKWLVWRVFLPVRPHPPPTLSQLSLAPPLAASRVALRACDSMSLPANTSAAVTMLSVGALTRQPPHPNFPSWHPGPCVAAVYKRWPAPQRAPPVYSILVNVHNRQRQIRLCLVQILKLTRGRFELILVDDGSTDSSLAVALDTLRRMDSWPPCPYSSQDVDEQYQWDDGKDPSVQGDVGRECVLLQPAERTLVRYVVVHIPSPGLFEAAADNIKMRVAHPSSEFFVLVHDDQLMTSPGWNVQLAQPMRLYGDVFAVSARCAHSWPKQADLVGPKCLNPNARQSQAWLLHIRDSANRGPLILRASAARLLGFLDEISYSFVDADHELNSRASRLLGMVAGFAAVPYTESHCCRARSDPRAAGLFKLLALFYQKRNASMLASAPALSKDLAPRRHEVRNLLRRSSFGAEGEVQ